MNRDAALLVVDDDHASREFEKQVLCGAGYQVRATNNGAEAMAMLAKGAFDAVLLDVQTPNMNGLDWLQRYREGGGKTPVIILSTQGNADDVVKAMQLGASDYLTRPVQGQDLLASAARALGQCSVPSFVCGDEEEKSFITQSSSMKKICHLIERIADTDVPVLLLGESGVGKEVVAREIHQRSKRKDRQFLKINCAALPSELLESELFGHERGAFTGATNEKPGKFELAHRGTIFLDEIGEMAIRLQAKLLQVLQDEEFFRVGGKKSIRVDSRILCATNRNLEAEIENGNFREDLYYRLNVVPVKIPPLRERREDIRPIFEYFVRKYRHKYSVSEAPLPQEVVQEILAYDFPGNVRELENLVRRLVVLRDPLGVLQELKEQRMSKDLGASIQYPSPPSPSFPISENEDVPLKDLSRRAAMLAEREAIVQMLTKTAWNKRKAALRLQISYKALLYKIKECGIMDPRQIMSKP